MALRVRTRIVGRDHPDRFLAHGPDMVADRLQKPATVFKTFREKQAAKRAAPSAIDRLVTRTVPGTLEF